VFPLVLAPFVVIMHPRARGQRYCVPASPGVR